MVYPIAHGGMAGVYVGRLPGMAGFEKLVALKVIHPHLAKERSFIDMFLDEARIAAGIHHPNVGEIYEVGAEDGLYYMIGELVLGQNLHSMVRALNNKKVTVPEAISAYIVAQVCLGLHAAHEQKREDGKPLGLVHRDVTPRNILVSYNGFVKLVDFGVAWARDKLSHTEVGTIKGKIGFMAPEQIRCESMDRRCDVFSLGVVLYNLLTGRHPFTAANDAATISNIIAGKPTPPSEIVPEIGPDLEEIVLTALANSPDKRYPTAAHMNEALEGFILSTDYKAGPAPLSRLMHGLFEESIFKHERLLRDHRRRKGEETGGLSVPPSLEEEPPEDGLPEYEPLTEEMLTEPISEPGPKSTSLETPAAIKDRLEEVSDRYLDMEPDSGSISVSYTFGEYVVKKLKSNQVLFAAGLAVAVAIALVAFFSLTSTSTGISDSESLIPTAASTADPDERPAPEPEPEIPQEITIQFEGLPAGAEVTLDGKKIDYPYTVSRSSSSVVVAVTATGYTPFEVTLFPDKNRTVDVLMKKEKPAVPDTASVKKVVSPKKKEHKPVKSKPAKPKTVKQKPVQPEEKKDKILINNPFG